MEYDKRERGGKLELGGKRMQFCKRGRGGKMDHGLRHGCILRCDHVSQLHGLILD